jgi:hypothetical protein
MGDEFLLRERALLSIGVPEEGRISLLRDGEPFSGVTGKTLDVEISERGVYRCEVFARNFGRYRPWIFSNPIYIR